MQRLAGDFLVKRCVQAYIQDEKTKQSNIVELYELPNGQWQFGKGRDATVVTSVDQVKEFDEGTQTAVAAWLDRIKHLPTAPPVVQGETPILFGESARDRLGRAISCMSEEVVNRLLMAVEQTIGPVADSLTQGQQVNHYSDGFGQDQGNHPPGPVAFQLPEGAWWAEEGRPVAGYFTPYTVIKDELGNIIEQRMITDGKGKTKPQWHPTPEFESYVAQSSDKTDVELEMDAERAKHTEESQLAASGSRRSSRSRR